MFNAPLPDLSWLSPEWFLPGTLLGFDWVNPFFLYLLPLVPVLYLVRWLVASRLRRRVEVALFSNHSPRSLTSLFRFVPGTVFSVFFMLVLLALARPQRSSEQVEISSEGIDILLIVDVSGSMEIEDFKPNRLEAAKQVAAEFIDGRSQDRIGLVVFAGEAFSLSPLTTDYALLKESIGGIELGMIQPDGTAIGNGLAVAINRLIESDAKSKVAILLSDGENTAGSLDPTISAHLAYSYGIKLYTIGIGQDGTFQAGTNEEGEPLYTDTRLEETTLRSIAAIGKGKFYRATGNDALRDIFKEIDQLEKTQIEQTRFKDTKDYYTVYLTWGILFFLVWLGLKNTFMANALED